MNKKKLVRFWIEEELWEFAKKHAHFNSSNASQMIRDYFVRLRREAEERGQYVDSQAGKSNLE
jgi:hypothetical protein